MLCPSCVHCVAIADDAINTADAALEGRRCEFTLIYSIALQCFV